VNPRGPRLAALLLVGAGLLLLLDNMGVFPRLRLADYWPLALSVLGLSLLSHCRQARGMIWPATLAVAGVLLTLGNLGMIHMTFGELWPLILIAVGLQMLLVRTWLPSARFRFRSDLNVAGSSNSSTDAKTIDENAVFGGIKRRCTAQDFEGGSLSAAFAGIELDLRRAGIAPGKEAVIDANAAFAGIEIRIPETWRVSLRGTAALGSFEDKSMPPRPEPGVTPPTLVITGTAAFGSIEVKN